MLVWDEVMLFKGEVWNLGKPFGLSGGMFIWGGTIFTFLFSFIILSKECSKNNLLAWYFSILSAVHAIFDLVLPSKILNLQNMAKNVSLRGGMLFKGEVWNLGKPFGLSGGTFIWVGMFLKNFFEWGVVRLFGTG